MLDTCKKQKVDDSRLSKMLELIACVRIGGISRNECLITFDSEYSWSDLYKLSAQQGVLAMVYDVVKNLPNECQPPRNIKLQWALSAANIERRYRKQEVLTKDLARIYGDNDIKTIVLKGLAISGYYPIPEHREFGDMDCFLVKSDSLQQGDALAINTDGLPISCYNKGNEIAAKIGAKVDTGFYKHSHIVYKGLMVENHAFCTAIRGSRNRKALERHLQHLLVTKPSTPIDDKHLLCPCADFNVLFLTAHSFGHFLTEGIKLRHVLDWALLLNAEQNNVDWNSFYDWCDRMHYTKFVDALTAFSTKYLGLTITNDAIRQHSNLTDKMLYDIMNSGHFICKPNTSKFRKRLKIIGNRLLGGWKYRELYEKSAIIDTIQMVWAFVVERKPKL